MLKEIEDRHRVLLNENLECRPFNKDGEKDGNRNYIHRIDVVICLAKDRKIIKQQEEEIQKLKEELAIAKEYRMVVDDRMVCLFLGVTTGNAKKDLDSLIYHENQIALDPLVSEAAAKLVKGDN